MRTNLPLLYISTTCFAVSLLIQDCNLNREPDDTGVELVGIFDPNAQGMPVGGLVDFSLSKTGSIPLVAGQAVFGDVALIPYPDLETCEGFNSLRPRAAVTSLNFEDAGDYINLEAEGSSFTITRDSADPDRYFTTKFGAQNYSVGTAYDVVIPGGKDIPQSRGTGSLKTPMDFDVSSPSLRGATGISKENPSPMEVRWSPAGSGGESFVVRIQVETKEEFKMIVCHAEDDGSFDIPGEILSTLPEGSGTMVFTRTTEGFVDLKTGRRAAATSEINRVGTVSVSK